MDSKCYSAPQNPYLYGEVLGKRKMHVRFFVLNAIGFLFDPQNRNILSYKYWKEEFKAWGSL